MSSPNSNLLVERLGKLGVRRMLLAIHDASFPVDADEDIGRGGPASRAATRLFGYLRDLGFTGIQLGPQGQTARSNPSPYDGTIFSRHLGNIGLASFRAGGAFEGLVEVSSIDRWLVTSERAQHAHAWDASHAILEEAYASLERGARPDLRSALDAFRRRNERWLVPDALHAALCRENGGAGFRAWDAVDRELWETPSPARMAELAATHARAIDQYAFGQLLVHEEHQRVRARCGLKLYGDLQVGYSDADTWRFAGAFLRGYQMGAPPSRTNPEGQPWGYPVLDPAQYAGAARELVAARAEKAFAEYDSLRIDHPHGLVCPWVYRAGTGDNARAAREGARLFESPDLPDHPELAPFSIARPDQIDRECPRYADRWVRELDASQIDRYALLLDTIIGAAEHHGRARGDLSCEVLSTMPTPLAAMLKRHGLGRWRVTQKANLDDRGDVYRSENAERADWVMLGNHDTAPIRSVIRGWSTTQRDKWCRHLTGLLHLAPAMQSRLASDGFLATAMLAELFASRAENVSIFFADLFGYTERFNVPGLVDDANWTLRLAPDFERLHADRLARGEALDLSLAAELALASASA